MRHLMIVAIVGASIVLIHPVASAQQEHREKQSPWSNLFDPPRSEVAPNRNKPLFPVRPSPSMKPPLPCSSIAIAPQDDRYDRKMEKVVPKDAPRPSMRVYRVPNCAQK